MDIFVAGASGVIGLRIVPLLVAAGHRVAAMTRSPGKRQLLEGLGAEPVVCDVYDAAALTAAVGRFAPELVMHQLTDLPDAAADIPARRVLNERMRSEGTRNLIAATRAANARRILAQSIAWETAGSAVHDHEEAILAADGVVLRYGQFYGPGTYFESELPAPPRVHVDEAARRTVELLDAPAGIVEIVERAA